MMDVLDVINAVAAVATALGIGVAVIHLQHARKQQRAEFEQQYIDQYRSIAARLPLEALLDDGKYSPSDQKARRAFYDYFELCEDEVFQWSQRPSRISAAAEQEWRQGIASNLARDAFRDAWLDLSSIASSQFELLRSSGLMPAPSVEREVK